MFDFHGIVSFQDFRHNHTPVFSGNPARNRQKARIYRQNTIRTKTNYMLFESVVTNSVYYGTFFILYLTGVWTTTLLGIALMFGIGNAFDSVVSAVAYGYFLKKNKYNILRVE